MDWQEKKEINTLLFYLEQFHVVDSVREYYEKHNNTAPPELLSNQIVIVRKLVGTQGVQSKL